MLLHQRLHLAGADDGGESLRIARRAANHTPLMCKRLKSRAVVWAT